MVRRYRDFEITREKLYNKLHFAVLVNDVGFEIIETSWMEQIYDNTVELLCRKRKPDAVTF